MTPAPKKAAPIPADVLALAESPLPSWLALTWTQHRALLRFVTSAIMQDRADRASQEERIREDERAKVEEAAYDWLWAEASEWNREDIQDWIVKVCGTRMSPADRARLRGDAS